ncbi:MAG: 4'-phosphopantetheinyl transferase superfamily protein [Mucilaginibacter sp.]
MLMFNTGFSSNVFSQYFTNELIGPEQLTDNEKLLTTNFSPKRLKDFSTGRYCARRALATIGYKPSAILIGQNNEPLWPHGAVGSISHSGQFTGAVVGLGSHFKCIGIDIETTGKINADMWDMLYTPAEQDFLNSYTGEELAFYTTLLFSFKESFYKMQYPLTHTFLEFTDVEVNLQDDGFKLIVIKEIDEKNSLPQHFPMYYLQEKNQVITLCYLANNH